VVTEGVLLDDGVIEKGKSGKKTPLAEGCRSQMDDLEEKNNQKGIRKRNRHSDWTEGGREMEEKSTSREKGGPLNPLDLELKGGRGAIKQWSGGQRDVDVTQLYLKP